MRAKKVQPRQQLIIIASAGVLFLVSAALASAHTLKGLEKQVFDFIYGWPNGLKPALWTITQLGSIWTFIAASLIFVWQQKKHLAAKLIICGLSSYLLTSVLKGLIDRPRPELLLPGVVTREIMAPGMGFPSGHTAAITVAALIIAPYLKKKYRWLAYLAIAMVAISRIYLGVHAPLDVVGGFALGVIIVKSYELLALKLKLEKVDQRD